MNDKIKLPYYVEFLFKNENLDIMRTLCFLYSIENCKTFIKVEELIFYYTLVISGEDMVINYDNASENEVKYNISNLYYTYQNNINNIILSIYNLSYIDVLGDIDTNLKDVKLKINNDGIEFMKNIETEYFIQLKRRFNMIRKKVKFVRKNVVKYIGG